MSHHGRHIGLVLCAIPLQKSGDDTKAGGADFRIVAVLIPVKVQKMNHQNQSLHKIEPTYKINLKARVVSSDLHTPQELFLELDSVFIFK